MNPKVNSGLWVIMIDQSRFITCNKRTPLVADVDNRGGHACVEAGGICTSLYLPLNFALNLKLLLKIVLI